MLNITNTPIQKLLQNAAHLHLAGHHAHADALYRQILAVDPRHAQALHLRGVLAAQAGQHERAIDLIRQSLAIDPRNDDAYSNLSLPLAALNRLPEAIVAAKRALELNPCPPSSHNNLGIAYKANNQLDQALASFQKAYALDPKYRVHSNLADAFKELGRISESVALLRECIALEPQNAAHHGELLYNLHFQEHLDPQELLTEHQAWNERHGRPLAPTTPPPFQDHSPSHRLRIGYVGSDFKDHCQSFFTIPLLSHHDHTKFEIIIYSSAKSADAITERLRKTADHWHDVHPLTDEQLAAKIRADSIDILIDLTMHMADNRLRVFAIKPAPIQISWLAYPATTGLTAIDYRFTDPHLDPPGTDPLYTEQSIRLPNSFWCYDPLTTEPPVNAPPVLTNGHITFGCLNDFYKVNPTILKIWSAVLQALPTSRLHLLAPTGKSRENILTALNTSPDRITFLDRTSRQEYLHHYHQIDIALDTFPYNGHTTSLDALWMGIPLITLVGSHPVSRAGLCQLTNLHLPELIAHTPQEFINIATTLAADLPRLTHLRQTLRPRMEASPLMDGKQFARDIESAYHSIWSQRCAGQSAP